MLSQEEVDKILNKEEIEYKRKVLSITDETELTNFLNNGFIIDGHTILLIDKDIQEHVSKYAPYKEDPEAGCYGFIRK